MNGHQGLIHARFGKTLAGAQRTLRMRSSRRILNNLAALSAAQAATSILGLIVLPYLAAVVGPKTLGMLALTQAAVQYSVLITNYGFSFSATRRAACCQDDPKRLAEIISHVWTAKCLLMLLCLMASLVAFAVIPSLHTALWAYLSAFATVIGHVLYLDWFFQAIEEMKWITIVNVIPKLILMPFVFVLVKGPSDYVVFLLIQSATFVATGVISVALARRRLPVPVPLPSVRGVATELKDGWHTFLATVSINVYTVTNTVVLGLMTNATYVGYYSAGQRLITGIQSLWTPVVQALYPHFCKAFQEEPVRAARQLRRLATVALGVSLCAAFILCLAAPYVVPLYLGASFRNSVGVIQVLVFSVCAVYTNTVLGLHGMVASGLYSSFLRVVFAAALASMILSPLAIWIGGYIGLAVANVAIEVSVAVYEGRFLRQRLIL
jgi:PST family polysaccharide transporter